MTTYIPLPIYRRVVISGLSVVALLCAVPAHAAQFTLESSSTAVAPASELTVNVYLDTRGESINAVGGTLSVPPLFEVVAVRDGGSVVPIWIEAPKLGATIVFSGITPGGYTGDRGLLFTVVLRAKGAGSAVLSLNDLQALKNDGQGTAALARRASLTLVVSSTASTTVAHISDTTLPEPFVIYLTQTPDAFDNQKVLIFTTQDKGSGMARYEICEGLVGSCVAGDSPYVLHRQQADTLFTVIAYDNAGNVRTVRLFTSAAGVRYSIYIILAILVGAGVRLVRRRNK